MTAFVALVLSIFSVASAAAMYGWDLGYQSLTSNMVECLIEKNQATFFMFIAYDKYTTVDPGVCNNLQQAQMAGISTNHLDVIYTPAPTSSATPPDQQVQHMVDNLVANCSLSWSGRVWLDMASHSLWPTPWRQAGYIENQQFFVKIVDACLANKGIKQCGIKSSSDEWKYILGSTTYTYAPAAALPLWYVNVNEQANFNDFVPFGGFTMPYGKKYHYDVNNCGGSSINEDYIPEW